VTDVEPPDRLLLAFRVLAWVTGVLLLLLVLVAVPLKYAGDRPWLSDQVGVVHGMVLYPAYVVVAFVLGYRSRWSLLRIVAVLLAGTVPFMSFVAERRVTAELRRAPGPAPAAAPAPPA